MTNPIPKSCKNCQTQLTGLYCAECGEKQITHADKSVLSIFSDFLNAFTNLDNKFLRSVWALFFKPGELTTAYNDGPRNRYTKPLSLFLIANVLLFFSEVAGVFDTPLKYQLSSFTYSEYAVELVCDKINDREISVDDYAVDYEKVSGNYAKTLIILILPIFAFFVMIFNWSKDRFYVDHFVFSMHIFTYMILFVMLCIMYLIAFSSFIFSAPELMKLLGDPYALFVILFFLIIYLFFAIKKIYPSKNYIVIIKTIILSFLLLISVQIYRGILFFVTFYLT